MLTQHQQHSDTTIVLLCQYSISYYYQYKNYYSYQECQIFYGVEHNTEHAFN